MVTSGTADLLTPSRFRSVRDSRVRGRAGTFRRAERPAELGTFADAPGGPVLL
ncbi:hypothetical protein L083_3200 [Actinoplanes sp. N902-109]|nr:hypothetical protein L083_3200 [Actinoplanes sp. N902-109]